MVDIDASARRTRSDLQLVAEMVEPNSRVLDVGCGDGALMEMLISARGADCRGIELSQTGVNMCVAKGLSVIQGDADADLFEYPDDAFDYVILSQTLQATRQPKYVLEQMLRIGKKAIISFPNFGHWRVRAQVLFTGRMPHTKTLHHHWYNTPNIHLCTILDFVKVVGELDVRIDQAAALNRVGARIRTKTPWWAWNLYGEQAVFLLRRKK